MKLSVLITLSLLAFCSCKKDFLDVNTQRLLTRQGYVKDLSTLEHFHNGIYLLLSRDYEKGIGSAYPELVADNLKPVDDMGRQALIAHYTWSQQSVLSDDEVMNEQSVTSNGLWRNSSYAIIRSCNFVIEEVGKYRTENPEKADRLKGEALAIRAMIHFRLVNIFAQPYNYSTNASHPGVPYITSSDITSPYKRNSVKEVYDKVSEELTESLNLIPATITDIRKINREAVKGLLARTYLFSQQYRLAKQLSEEILTRNPILSIEKGYPDAVFKHLPMGQTESLFQLTPINLGTDNSYFLNLFLQFEPTTMFLPTKDIADILIENPNDIRKNWVVQSGTGFIAKKFPLGVAQEKPEISLPETSYYPCIVRSSELLLTAAEAAAKLSEEDIARDHLNSIRKRADPSAIPVIATGPALLDSIYKERRKELCFEGWRLYDLQRWNLGIHRKDVHPSYASFKDLNYPNDRSIAPIPYEEITYAGLIPNPGY
jgi:endonuclease III